MTNPTLLFIPDISGFTDFVNTTEINHSRHIISELLEIIVNSDNSGMNISEIEGDAVLFFKDDIPALSDLIEQCQTTFLNFHNHLRRYDTERICRCGACETASKLSLKFIIHKGEVGRIDVRDHHKLHGSDVILAHKLLKNSVPENEYILISNGFRDSIKPLENAVDSWFRIESGNDTYKQLGEVKYVYISLKDLFNKLEEPTSISIPGLSPDRIKVESAIHAPIDIIYDNYTNLDKRVEWNEDIKKIILHGDRLNKSGSLHTCLTGPYVLDFESIGRLENKDRVIYSERLNKFNGLRDIISVYTFEKHADHTRLKIEIDYKIKSWIGKVIKPWIKKMIQKQTESGLQKLKVISEKESGKV